MADRLHAEFTTEPFLGEQDHPPAHAEAARDAVERAGLECDFGPLGTSFTGSEEQVLATLDAVMATALANGASAVTTRVERMADDA